MRERPEVSQEVINLFSKLVDDQDDKGIEKYNETIDDAKGYNWEMMALEESVDLNKYLVKKIRELEKEISQLKRSV